MKSDMEDGAVDVVVKLFLMILMEGPETFSRNTMKEQIDEMQYCGNSIHESEMVRAEVKVTFLTVMGK